MSRCSSVYVPNLDVLRLYLLMFTLTCFFTCVMSQHIPGRYCTFVGIITHTWMCAYMIMNSFWEITDIWEVMDFTCLQTSMTSNSLIDPATYMNYCWSSLLNTKRRSWFYLKNKIFNLLTPESDWHVHVISIYNVHTLPSKLVIRKLKLIQKKLWSNAKFS